MATVRVLPPEVANQIAAGEVVERPASVVKELVENALDAGAARLTLRLEGGGADLVEVADDGCGMTPDDARLAVERHATSKVSTAADLHTVRSFGFRGEALPSIGSVSRLTLTTSDGSGAGTRVRVEAGRLLPVEPAAHPRGTTVRVEALFHNAPARRKFLRAPGTEAAHALDHLGRIAAAHPGVSFRLVSGERPALDWPAVPDLRARAAQILGRDETAALLPVDRSEGRSRLRGLVSTPALLRASPRDEWLYVNARPVRDRRLLHAVHQAYATLVPRGRYGVAFLFLEVPTDEVDVNVHPAKSEVRFARPGAIHDLVLRGVREALGQSRPFAVVAAPPLTLREADPTGAPDDSWARREPAPAAGRPGSPGAAPAEGTDAATGVLQPGTELRALAQFRDTYILASAPDGLVIVDQHAAHERILYERLMDDAEAARVERQRLLFPLVLEVPPAQRAAFEAARPAFADLGFALELFGPDSLRVEEVPGFLPAPGAEALVRALLADLLDHEQPRAAADLRHRIAALSACHAAVRAREALPGPSLDRLVVDLMRARAPMTCPHGRPTILRLPLERLEREFRRR